MSALRDEIVHYLNDYLQQVNLLVNTRTHVYEYGPQTVRRIGVVTGGGQGYVMEAIAYGCDTFLTGEVGEPTEAIAREEGINFIGIGHYNSEKIGLQALSNLLEAKFGVETFFCDVPNQV